MPAPVMVACDLNETVRQAVFLQRVGNPGIDYQLILPEGEAGILGDERLIVQALTNILKNAGEAVVARIGAGGEGGLIETALEEAGGEWLVSVTDNGVGLPADDRERLTEPYMTTRVKGTGLGLAIVRKVVEDHGGRILLEDAPDRSRSGRAIPSGARVTIAIPRRVSGAESKREGPHEQQ
jgi:two-component system nitrogen regulation sensor histidine kinase NtrY